VYFYEHSVLNLDLKKIDIGAEVKFSEEQDDQGHQAGSVSVVGKHHLVG